MPACIQEQIIENIVETLQGITTGNGYANNLDPANITRPNPGLPAKFGNLRILVLQGNPVRQDSEPQKGREWSMPVQIICSVVESEQSNAAIDTRLNSIRADVEKILMVDIHRDSLAHNTEIDDPDYADLMPNSRTGEVTVNVNIRFRTRWNDPYTLQ